MARCSERSGCFADVHGPVKGKSTGSTSAWMVVEPGSRLACVNLILSSAWVRWDLDWDARPGTSALQARATDSNGNIRPDQFPSMRKGFSLGCRHAPHHGDRTGSLTSSQVMTSSS